MNMSQIISPTLKKLKTYTDVICLPFNFNYKFTSIMKKGYRLYKCYTRMHTSIALVNIIEVFEFNGSTNFNKKFTGYHVTALYSTCNGVARDRRKVFPPPTKNRKFSKGWGKDRGSLLPETWAVSRRKFKFS